MQNWEDGRKVKTRKKCKTEKKGKSKNKKEMQNWEEGIKYCWFGVHLNVWRNALLPFELFFRFSEVRIFLIYTFFLPFFVSNVQNLFKWEILASSNWRGQILYCMCLSLKWKFNIQINSQINIEEIINLLRDSKIFLIIHWKIILIRVYKLELAFH